MAIIKKSRGTGITERSETIIKGSIGEPEQQAIGEVFGSIKDLADYLSGIEEYCGEIMRKAGLPDAYGKFQRRSGGNWEARNSDEAMAFDAAYVNGLTGIARHEGLQHDTPEGYAARAIDRCHEIRVAIDEGEPVGAAMAALRLGNLLTEAAIKFAWDAHAMRGLKQLQGARTGGELRHGSPELRRRKREKIAQAFIAESSNGQSYGEAGAAVAAKFEISTRTVRRAVKAWKSNEK